MFILIFMADIVLMYKRQRRRTEVMSKNVFFRFPVAMKISQETKDEFFFHLTNNKDQRLTDIHDFDL